MLKELFNKIAADFSKRVIHDKRGVDPFTIAALASTGAGIASKFLGKNKSGGESVPLFTPAQTRAQDDLGAFVNNFLGKFTPGKQFEGDRVAPLTDLEQTGLGQLSKLLSTSPTGDLFNAGKKQISDTLSGKFADPQQSPFIRSQQILARQGLEDAITTSRRKAGARGKFFSSSAIAEEADLTERSQNALNSIIGSFIDRERGRQFQAAPIAQQFDQFENLTAPLQQIGASQSLGGLSRIVEQGRLEAEYQDFLRQQKELGSVPGVAQNFSTAPFGIQSLTAPITEQPSSLSNILGLIGQLNTGALKGKGSSIDKLTGLFKNF